MKPPPALVWGIATLMVTIVSCCSLIGVSIMPLISGPSYKTFITLFTGLAVGSLLGSAIFSLIPQAFGLHLTNDKAYLWKSLMIFFGVYLFYCSERLMRLYFDHRAKSNLKREQSKQISLKKNKSNSNIPEVANSNHDASDDSNSDEISSPVDGDNVTMTDIGFTTNKNDEQIIQATSSRSTEPSKLHNHHHHHHHIGALIPHDVLKKEDKVRGLPARKEIAPVAWMIIIGDGIHNFIDGLSIGAAFSESIVLGLTTSVAVIFEEFPHELGDFAVLISSGMTVRQALGFNFLSALTCYIGMIFGILLGDLTQSASFIFALAGGMFLYISLVDMMGELSAMLEESRHSIREVSRLLVMQNIGILSGIIIIFFLSLKSNG